MGDANISPEFIDPLLGLHASGQKCRAIVNDTSMTHSGARSKIGKTRL